MMNPGKLAALEEIRNANGGMLTPEAFVDVASHEGHVLHDLFDWDDVACAHQHRLEQARKIIRSVRFETKVMKRTTAVPYYVSLYQHGADRDETPKSPGYAATAEVKTNRDVAVAVVLAELERAQSLLMRASDLASALDVRVDLEVAIKVVSNSIIALAGQRAVGA